MGSFPEDEHYGATSYASIAPQEGTTIYGYTTHVTPAELEAINEWEDEDYELKEITVKVKGEEKQAHCYVMKPMNEYSPPDDKYMRDVLLTIKTFYQLSMGMVTKLKLSLPIIRADTMEEQEQRLLEL